VEGWGGLLPDDTLKKRRGGGKGGGGMTPAVHASPLN